MMRKMLNVLASCHSNTAHGYYSIQQMEADNKLLLVKLQSFGAILETSQFIKNCVCIFL